MGKIWAVEYTQDGHRVHYRAISEASAKSLAEYFRQINPLRSEPWTDPVAVEIPESDIKEIAMKCDTCWNGYRHDADCVYMVVNAIRSGECPKCHDIFDPQEMRECFSAANNGSQGWRCPGCEFQVTKEEARLAVKEEFGGYMEQSLEVFERWRREGFHRA